MLKKCRRITGLFLVICLLLSAAPNVRAATGTELEPQYATGTPIITSVGTVSGDLVKGEQETVRVTIFFDPSQTVSYVNCTVKIYFQKDSANIELANKQVVITGTTSIDFPVTFPAIGSAQIYAKLYKSTQEIGSRSQTITVIGRWRIQIKLPANRLEEGILILYDGNGNTLLMAQCLGQSESKASMYVENGNTPTGEYTGVLWGPESDTGAYGPHKVVALTGVSGAIITSGRSGIWIHGGRYPSPTATNYELTPTNGCVRVTNGHQQQIQDLITALINQGYHHPTGNVSIVEVG